MPLTIGPRRAVLLGGGAFTPTSIAGLVLWLKADAITGLTDGSDVVTWPDSSGGGRTVSGSATRPVYKTGIVNGLPVVRFPGSNQRFTIGSPSFVSLDEMTIVMVYYYDQAIGFNRGLISLTNASYRISVLGRQNPSGVQMDVTQVSPSAGYSESQALNANVWAIVTMRMSMLGNDVRAFVNGTSASGTAPTFISSGAGGTFYLGYSSTEATYFPGDIAEMLVYSNAVSANSRVLIERYLSTKYAINLA